MPALLAQEAPHVGNWILLELEGSRSDRSAIGARVRVRSESGVQYEEVRGGGSYLSQSELRLHFGLGTDARADVEVLWPSGVRQTLERLEAGRVHKIGEPD